MVCGSPFLKQLMTTKIILPEMGEGVIEGTIARWLKNEGDQVEEHEPLLEIETDKVTTEAEAENGGVLLKILVAEGETVPVGTVLALIGEPGEEMGVAAAVTPAEPPPPQGENKLEPAAVGHPNGLESESVGREETGWVSPVVARMAAEHGLDLTRIAGTGLKGRITKNDVLTYLETRPAAPALTAPPPPAAYPAAGKPLSPTSAGPPAGSPRVPPRGARVR